MDRGCGVVLLSHMIFVAINGTIGPGLDPTSVSFELDDDGNNTDLIEGASLLPFWYGHPSMNSSALSGVEGFAGTGSMSVSSDLLNRSAAGSAYYVFFVPVPIQVTLQPLVNGTVGLDEFHLSASLLGLGTSILASMALSIANDYS
jgi:hypothetical protein